MLLLDVVVLTCMPGVFSES